MTLSSSETAKKDIGGGTLGSMQVQFSLFLYLIYPAFAGFISAMQSTGRTYGWPLEFRLAYYLPLALIGMSIIGILCHLISKPARKLHIPLWLLLIVGVQLAGPLLKLYVQTVVPVFDLLLPNSVSGGSEVDHAFTINLRQGIPTTLTWVGLNLFGWYFLGLERFGYAPPKTTMANAWAQRKEKADHGFIDDSTAYDSTGDSLRQGVPTFAKKAGLKSIDQIGAIEAQQHYIKILTDDGSKTVLFRFSDAVEQLPKDSGLRVHRSWWVHKDFVESISKDKNRLFLNLKNGMQVPVSRTYYLAACEMLGLEVE